MSRDELVGLIERQEDGRTALLVSHDFSMSGAPIALLSMADALRRLGYCPIILSRVDGPLRSEAERQGFATLVLPDLFSGSILTSVAQKVALVVANTLVCGPIVLELNGTDAPVLWWIHEAQSIYSEKHLLLAPHLLCNNVMVAVVGPYAQQMLLQQRPHLYPRTLLYGLDDLVCPRESDVEQNQDGARVITFACVGTLQQRKGQDILVEAFRLLPEEIASRCKLLIVGRPLKPDVTSIVLTFADENPELVTFIPQIERKDMPKFYQSIDCLICPSRDDPMPITVTEACMFSKLIICSEHTGSAELLRQYEAGFVYEHDDPSELAELISKVVLAQASETQPMRLQARRLYEEHFTKEVFASNLQALIADLQNRGTVNEADQRVAQALRDLQNQTIELKDRQTDTQNKLARTEKSKEELERQYNQTVAERDDLRDRIAQLEREARAARERCEALHQQCESLQQDLNRAEANYQKQKSRADSVTRSRSWRYTAPIRAAGQQIKGLRKRRST